MKIRTALACAALSVGALIALPGAASAAASDTYEATVINLTNVHRANHDKVRLRSNTCVDRHAESHARWLANHQTLKHQSMSNVLKKCGLKYVGENIAGGCSTGSSVVSAWMHSSGHRANILKSSYRLIGVGAAQDGNGDWWVSQVFGTKK